MVGKKSPLLNFSLIFPSRMRSTLSFCVHLLKLSKVLKKKKKIVRRFIF